MTETGNTVERLTGWLEDSPLRSRYHRPYANPGELRADVRAALAVVEAAQELDESYDATHHRRASEKLRDALTRLHSSEAWLGKASE